MIEKKPNPFAVIEKAGSINLLSLIYVERFARFRDLQKLKMSDHQLSKRLKEFRAAGLVERVPDSKAHVFGYALTPHGETVTKHLVAIRHGGLKND